MIGNYAMDKSTHLSPHGEEKNEPHAALAEATSQQNSSRARQAPRSRGANLLRDHYPVAPRREPDDRWKSEKKRLPETRQRH